MIGGPEDGNERDLSCIPDTIRGEAPIKPGLDETTGIFWAEPLNYRRSTVEVLGLRIPVFILDGWPTERIEATLATALLSPQAHLLAEGML